MRLFVVVDEYDITFSDLVANAFSLERRITYLNKLFNSKTWRVREATWQEREREMFSKSLYTEPPWHEEKFWKNPNFAHVADDPSMIEFSDERGRKVTMRPGKYLTRFFEELTKKQVAFYAEWFVAGEKPPLDLDYELKFATTPEEIIHVYAEGPSSCMHDSESVGIYGAGDLAIVYLENGDGIRARALCWPDKMVVGRIYPNPGSWSDDGFSSYEESEEIRQYLLQQMRGRGYKHTDEGGSFEGAKLALKWAREGRLVMPYLDHITRISVKSDHLILTSEGNVTGDSTSGWVYADPAQETICYSCEEEIEDDEVNVLTRFNGTVVTLCCSCSEEETFYCDGSGETYYTSTTEPIYMINGQTWEINYFDHNGFYDPETGEAHPVADGVMHNNQLHYRIAA